MDLGKYFFVGLIFLLVFVVLLRLGDGLDKLAFHRVLGALLHLSLSLVDHVACQEPGEEATSSF